MPRRIIESTVSATGAGGGAVLVLLHHPQLAIPRTPQHHLAVHLQSMGGFPRSHSLHLLG